MRRMYYSWLLGAAYDVQALAAGVIVSSFFFIGLDGGRGRLICVYVLLCVCVV
jgi:hypothetical protein